MLSAQCCLSRPVTSETKNRLSDSGVTQFDSLFRKRNTEPFGAFSREPASTRHRSVAIRVCFHNRHHARRRTYTIPDLVEVCRQVVEIDLGPRRPANNILVTLKMRHNSAYHLRAPSNLPKENCT